MDELHSIAREALDTFEEITSTARLRLSAGLDRSTDSFVSVNIMTSGNAHKTLAGIQRAEDDGLRSLILNPSFMRMIIEDDSGNQRKIYLSQSGQLTLPSKIEMASYRKGSGADANASIGRLAELPLGESADVKLPSGKKRYYVIEKISFTTQIENGNWDSKPSVYRHCDKKTSTVPSLREILELFDLGEASELERMLAESDLLSLVQEGVSHQVRTASGLRDQPILDQFQGEIFRLPLDQQLIILGPPGTGKTTTLIKRLGQKLDLNSLDADEYRLAEQNNHIRPHQQSWLMFTPSELLKHYLKEAFNQENISAPDSHVRTWISFRQDFARNSLGILKSPNGGRFILSADTNLISNETIQDPRKWYAAFRFFHEDWLKQQLKIGFVQIQISIPESKISLIDKVKEILTKLDVRSLMETYRVLKTTEAELLTLQNQIKESYDSLIKKEQNRIFNKNKKIFIELFTHLESVKQTSESTDDEEIDEDLEEEVSIPSTASTLQIAINAYVAAIRSLARNTFLKKAVPKSGRNAAVLEFLGNRIPEIDVLKEIGRASSLQAGLGKFIKPHQRYVSAVSSNFVRFRNSKDAKEKFYSTASKRNAITPVELDFVILAILRNARELLGQNFVKRDLEQSEFEYLRNIAGHFRNQIMVDEATDFSMLELACIESLTSLSTRSFFACGDFNQRITSTGIRDYEQLAWVSQQLKKHSIQLVYRQSRQLNKFTNDLLELQQGDLSAAGQLPEESTHEGVSPALVEHIHGDSEVRWLADRINEVEKSVGAGIFPTIGVLVNHESAVQPMAEQLTRYLTNLQAVACSDGRYLGEGTDVRVFDIRHIKGLEFEAVFFVGIDELVSEKPELFDRYLYVGATRAATYLGLTCTRNLPESLESLRQHFVSNWS
ncbi:ATP-binding domain-containing protein [Thalassolituus sp.]|jgi:DNA polymerase III delta prime subunit|uniref:ATP-binding domain-containing protein n=1 Tax=Thalassolituus sp. TaxID=2030822 RepID=UPI0032D9230C